MSRQTFAQHAGAAPFIPTCFRLHSYTCHMSALYWAFRDLGDSGPEAAARIEEIAKFNCNGCQTRPKPGVMINHSSIPHPWYGQKLCFGALPVVDAQDLMNYAEVGDVILVGAPQRPMHSMVVVNAPAPGQPVSIRGFNNTNTLGTGTHLQYDNADRVIAPPGVPNYWHLAESGKTVFGLSASSGGPAYRLDYDTFVTANAATIRRQFKQQDGGLVYTGN